MYGSVDIYAETSNQLYLKPNPSIFTIEAERHVVRKGGHLQGMTFEFGQLRHGGQVHGVDTFTGPVGKHAVESAVGFHLYDEVVELLAEFPSESALNSNDLPFLEGESQFRKTSFSLT